MRLGSPALDSSPFGAAGHRFAIAFSPLFGGFVLSRPCFGLFASGAGVFFARFVRSFVSRLVSCRPFFGCFVSRVVSLFARFRSLVRFRSLSFFAAVSSRWQFQGDVILIVI